MDKIEVQSTLLVTIDRLQVDLQLAREALEADDSVLVITALNDVANCPLKPVVQLLWLIVQLDQPDIDPVSESDRAHQWYTEGVKRLREQV